MRTLAQDVSGTLTQALNVGKTMTLVFHSLSFYCDPGATLEEINQHWNWLGWNLLHTLSVFDNKDDMASFVKGKVKVGPLISTFIPISGDSS